MKIIREIPSVDLSDFTNGNPERKTDFVQQIGTAFEEIGFVALKGHFLENKLVEDLYREIRDFFDLPLETKLKYEVEGIGGQRGFTSFGKEHAKGRTVGDLKEFWHFGQQLSDQSKYKGVYPENVAVNELPGFNKTGNLTYKMLEKTGVYLLRALALYIGLDEFYFDQYVAGRQQHFKTDLLPAHYRRSKRRASRSSPYGHQFDHFINGCPGKRA